MPNPIDPSYLSTVRSAHSLASLLNKSHPELHAQIEELQATVTKAHKTLHELDQRLKASDVENANGQGRLSPVEGMPSSPSFEEDATRAMAELTAAYQSLRNLTHPSKRTK